MRKYLINFGKLTVAIAAAWGVGASLYIFFSPVTISGVTSTLFRDSSEVVRAFTRQQSWYEAQGLWGVLVLLIFSGFYLLAARLAFRGNNKGLLIMSVVALVLSVVAGFSIGGVYLPAALGLFIGALLLLSSSIGGSLRAHNS